MKLKHTDVIVGLDVQAWWLDAVPLVLSLNFVIKR